MRLGLLVLIGGLAACNGGADKETGTATDNGETDTDADTDSDTDTDADADADSDTDSDTDTGTGITDPDTDGDGLTDSEEATYGSNPTKVDTDGDGLSDGDEVHSYGTDPILSDTDGDSASDGDEIAAGTNPLVQDTDGDGLLDGVELQIGTDPNAADSDLDGLEDGDEYYTDGTDPLLADTDNDGLSDFDEVNGVTDPVVADTDGDGLLDGEEAGYGTDPTRADTDADGLADGAEIAAGTDPLDPDTDNDTVTDGLEVNFYTSDPLSTDSDGDGLDDGQEVGLGTSLILADTDFDGLSDPIELFQIGTDPLDADTDNGGTYDGQEVLVDGTDPFDPSDDVGCAYPDVPVVDGVVPPSGNLEPIFVGVDIIGTWDGTSWRDWSADTDGDGVAEDYAATVTFTIFDSLIQPICTVTADLEHATPAAVNWTTDGGALYQGWDLDLSTANSDCDGLDSAIYGTTDIRDILAAKSWGVGIGDLTTIEPDLEAAVTGAGLDWVNDWLPYVNGEYVTLDGINSNELGFSFSYDDACGLTTFAPMPALAGGPVPTSITEADEYYVYDWADISGIAPSCVPPVVDVYDPAYVPPAPVMSPTYYAFSYQGLVWDGDNLSDFQDTTYAYSTLLQFDIYDAAATLLCSVYFDASVNTWVDPATFVTSLGGAPAPNSLTDAWQVTLSDGVSTCNRAPVALVPSGDIRDYFDPAPGSPVWVGLGPFDGIGPAYQAYGAGVYGANDLWTEALSLNGVNMDYSGEAFVYPITACPEVDFYSPYLDPTLGPQDGAIAGFPFWLYTL